MGSSKGHARETLLFEHGHSGLDRFCFTRDDGHFWRVLIGGNHVTIGGFENRFNRAVRGRNAGHQAFVVNFNRTHFGPPSSSGSKGAIHVQNPGRHESSVFAQRMTGHHVRRMAVGLERTFNGQVGREHRRLRVLGLLEFVLRFLEFVLGEGRTQHKSRECFTIQHLHHGFVRLLPYISRGRETLNQVGGHADVLASLARVHMDGLGFGRHGRLVG